MGFPRWARDVKTVYVVKKLWFCGKEKVPGVAFSKENHAKVFFALKELITIKFVEKYAIVVCASYCRILWQNSSYFVLNDAHMYILGAFNKFPDLFVEVFEIVVNSWKFTM